MKSFPASSRLARLRGALPLLLLPLALLAAPDVDGAQGPQPLVSYTFAGLTGAPATTAPGVVATDLVRDHFAATFYDNSAGNRAPDANSNGWTTAAALDPALYYTFAVTPAAGGATIGGFTLDLANFDAAGINDGPTAFAVRSSLDGFTANLLTGTVGASFATYTAAPGLAANATVEFRVYGYAAGTAGGLLQIDNVTLTAAAVPEPSSVAATVLAVALLGGHLRRRARRPAPVA